MSQLDDYISDEEEDLPCMSCGREHGDDVSCNQAASMVFPGDDTDFPCVRCGLYHLAEVTCEQAQQQQEYGIASRPYTILSSDPVQSQQEYGTESRPYTIWSSMSPQDEEMTDANDEEEGEEEEQDDQDVDMTDLSQDEEDDEEGGEDGPEEGGSNAVTPVPTARSRRRVRREWVRRNAGNLKRYVGTDDEDEDEDDLYRDEDDDGAAAAADDDVEMRTATTPYSGSTSEYGHESWSTFKYKVLKQARVHFNHEGYLTTSHLHGGSFNRVASIELNGMPRWIIRMSREAKITMNDLAPLFFLEKHTTIPSPKVVAWEPKRSNVWVERPYMIMDRLKGDVLTDTYRQEFTSQEKDQVARELGLAYREMIATESSAAGIPVFPPNVGFPQKETPTYIAPFDPERGLRGNAREDLAKPWDPNSPPEQAPYDILKGFFEMELKRYRERLNGLPPILPTDDKDVKEGKKNRKIRCELQIKFWRFFSHCMDQMEEMGYLPADMPNVLFHTDVAQRNLIFDRRAVPDGEGLGILDWDDCYFLPAFLACRPPAFLWSDEINQDYYNEVIEAEPVLSEEEERRKAIFFEAAGEEYTNYANDQVYQCAREYFRAYSWGLHAEPLRDKAVMVTRVWRKIWDRFCNESDEDYVPDE